MMLSLEEGKVIAKEKLKTLISDATLYDEPIHTGDYGWVFSYQSTRYMDTNDIRDALVGNSPILVDRSTRDALVLGSGLPAESYVENYVACGDPFKFLGRRVEVSCREDHANKVEAIRVIRRKAGLGIVQAKSRIDDCLAGKPTVVTCPSVDIAKALVRDLWSLGFFGKQLRD